MDKDEVCEDNHHEKMKHFVRTADVILETLYLSGKWRQMPYIYIVWVKDDLINC